MALFNRGRIAGASVAGLAASKKANVMATDKGFSFPSDLSADFCFKIETKEVIYSRSVDATELDDGRAAGKTIQPRNTFFLPIPGAIQDNLGVNYNVSELGAIGGVAADLVSELASAVAKGGDAKEMGTQAFNGVRNMISSGMDNLMKSTTTDKLAAINAVAAQLGAPAGATGVAGLMLGKAPNPHVTAFFKGVELKKHSFSWDLWPQSQADANKLESMVNTLRRDATPNRVGGGLSLTYPYEAHCTLITKGNTFTVMFKPAFITNISLNYTPQGPAFLEDGHAAGMTLTIGLQETDIWLREDYPDGLELSDGAKASGNAFKSMGSPLL
jgi:hypothetical protein|tara:strand:- start:1700 stop:2686 length:987 start_codon:yes stop_codon:yes gene_type:complete